MNPSQAFSRHIQRYQSASRAYRPDRVVKQGLPRHFELHTLVNLVNFRYPRCGQKPATYPRVNIVTGPLNDESNTVYRGARKRSNQIKPDLPVYLRTYRGNGQRLAHGKTVARIDRTQVLVFSCHRCSVQDSVAFLFSSCLVFQESRLLLRARDGFLHCCG